MRAHRTTYIQGHRPTFEGRYLRVCCVCVCETRTGQRCADNIDATEKTGYAAEPAWPVKKKCYETVL